MSLRANLLLGSAAIFMAGLTGPSSGIAGDYKDLAHQLAIFDQSCPHYFSTAECEGAVRYLLVQRGDTYLLGVNKTEDGEEFLEQLGGLIARGKPYRPAELAGETASKTTANTIAGD